MYAAYAQPGDRILWAGIPATVTRADHALCGAWPHHTVSLDLRLDDGRVQADCIYTPQELLRDVPC
jgi:hypothetical protein